MSQAPFFGCAFFSSAFFSCAVAAAQPAQAPAPPRPSWDVSLRLKVALPHPPGWRAVSVHGDVRSGERFALDVKVARPVFLWVAQRKGKQEFEIVHPPSAGAAPPGGAAARPDRAVSLPSSGNWFLLDNHAGQDAVYMLASTAPLTQAHAVRILAERADAACVRAREPPPVLRDRDRGEVVNETLSPDGTALLCFPFLHR